MLLLFTASFAFRFQLGDRGFSTFDVALAVAALPWLIVASTRRKAAVPPVFYILGGASILLILFSFGFSQFQSVTLLYLISTIEGIFALVVIVTMLGDAPARQIVRLITGFLILLLIPAALLWAHIPGFLPPATLDPTQGDYLSYFARLSHPFIGRSNNFAALTVVLIVPLAAWALTTKQRAAQFGAFLALVITVLTVSRGALLSLFAAFILYFFVDGKTARRLFGRAAIILIPVALIGALVLLFNDTTAQFFSTRFSSDGVTARTGLLEVAQQILTQNWLTGTGAGVSIDVHNTFIQQMIYFGVIGGLIVSVLLFAVAFRWFSRSLPQRWLAAAIGVGMLAQLGSFFVESSYEGTLLRPLIWVTWALLIALYNAAVRTGDQYPLFLDAENRPTLAR